MEETINLLTDLENKIESANTPKPYEFNLLKEIYSQETEAFWKKYQKDHPYIIFNFLDKDRNSYKLVEGKLVL